MRAGAADDEKSGLDVGSAELPGLADRLFCFLTLRRRVTRLSEFILKSEVLYFNHRSHWKWESQGSWDLRPKLLSDALK